MSGTLGIIAGSGALPRELIANCLSLQRKVFVLAINGATDAETVAGVAHEWINLGAVGHASALLRRAGCHEVCLIGGIARPSFADLKPDLQGVRLLPKVMAAAREGDDALLRVIVEFLEDSGFVVLGAEQILAPLQAPAGAMGRHHPDGDDKADIDKGVELIRALGAYDVGQAVVVRSGQVLAIETAEGTDAMLHRCAPFRLATPGGVLVKCPKPDQDRRMDLPTIGPETIAGAAAAGLKGVAIAAGGALIAERDATIRQADQCGLFVVGVAAEFEPSN